MRIETQPGRECAGALSLLLIVGACRGDGAETTTTTTISNVGGDNFPAGIEGVDYHNTAEPVTGRLVLAANGCWRIDLGEGPRLVIFPPGTTQHPVDGSIVFLADGTEVMDGSEVEGLGGIVSSDQLPGPPVGFWASYVTFCGTGDVVILDSVGTSSETRYGSGVLAALAEAEVERPKVTCN